MSIDNKCIVVTGLMRSGTSLLMQSLQSAGVECLGEYPGFEDQRMEEEGILPKDLMLDSQGKAVKILEPHCRFIPRGFPCYIIYAKRGSREQAKSYIKFIKSLGKRLSVGDKIAVRKMRAMLCDHSRLCDKIIDRIDFPKRQVRFEKLVTSPTEELRPIAEDLQLDLSRMIAPIRLRDSKCLPDMLERDLLVNGSSVC